MLTLEGARKTGWTHSTVTNASYTRLVQTFVNIRWPHYKSHFNKHHIAVPRHLGCETRNHIQRTEYDIRQHRTIAENAFVSCEKRGTSTGTFFTALTGIKHPQVVHQHRTYKKSVLTLWTLKAGRLPSLDNITQSKNSYSVMCIFLHAQNLAEGRTTMYDQQYPQSP